MLANPNREHIRNSLSVYNNDYSSVQENVLHIISKDQFAQVLKVQSSPVN